jgi:Bacterial extracellular solute-binding proteins, family 3
MTAGAFSNFGPEIQVMLSPRMLRCVLASTAMAMLISRAEAQPTRGTQAQQAPTGGQTWPFHGALRICTASISDFGGRCNRESLAVNELGGRCSPEAVGQTAALKDELSFQLHPPSEGLARNFCGYEVDLFWMVADALGLQADTHYVHVCTGENGFQLTLDDLAGVNKQFNCDMAVSTITASADRQKQFSFSAPTHRGFVATLVNAPLRPIGMWAFLKPLEPGVRTLGASYRDSQAA